MSIETNPPPATGSVVDERTDQAATKKGQDAPIQDTNGVETTEGKGSTTTAAENNNDDEATLLASMVQSLPTPPNPQTYSTTKSSQFYTLAKANLQAGNFESALSTIERGLTTLLEIFAQYDDEDHTEEDGQLHESLAPLYYLYGTTLLYSVEESRDSSEEAIMATTSVSPPGEDREGDVSSVPQTSSSSTGGGDSADDIQIAWENLESARSILQHMIDTDSSSSSTSTMKSSESSPKSGIPTDCLMDLAQIYSRLGDLSRHNGHHKDAIRDYNLCRTQRRECLSGDGGAIWDRRVADVEYSLGMTCLLLASEGEKNLENAGAATDAASAAPSNVNPNDSSKVTLSPQEIQTLRDDSIRHYLECGRILGGMIGFLCGKDPTTIVNAPGQKSPPVEDTTSTIAAATIPQSPDASSSSSSLYKETSLAFQTIRKRVRDLTPSPSSPPDTAAQVEDLREMLDEIQETIDTCETDREGLGVVNAMRRKAEEQVARADGQKEGEVVDEEGGMTTIGFGTGGGSAAVEVTPDAGVTIGVGSKLDGMTKRIDVGEPQAAKPVPMMVIKKKKKKKVAVVETTVADAGGDLKRVRID